MKRTMLPIGLFCMSGLLLASERPCSKDEMIHDQAGDPRLRLNSLPWIDLTDQDWRYMWADDPSFANPGLDDSKWGKVLVNCPLSRQETDKRVPAPHKLNRTFGWYRCHFTLPEGTQRNNFELRIGAVSLGDETYINGIRVGSYGINPAVLNSSNKNRFYFSCGTNAILQAGDNVIAIRCQLGYKNGLYNGKVELRKIPDPSAAGYLTHRSQGKSATARQLTAVAELNRFQPGERIYCRPELTLLSSRPSINGIFSIQLRQNGKTAWRKEVPMTLRKSFWITHDPMELPALPKGRYDVSVSFTAEGKELWRKNTTMTLADPDLFNLKEDPELAVLDAAPLPLAVDDCSFGSFGLRNVNAQKRLFDDYRRYDTRGTPEFLVTFGPDLQGALLSISCVKPMPKPRDIYHFSHSIGTQHDHFTDAWVLGEIAAGAKQGLPVLSTEKVCWTGRSVRYRYASGGSFLLTLSQLSPALACDAENLETMSFFRRDPATGLGAPTRMYCEKQGTLQASDTISEDVQYVVLSYENAAGYEEFNIPVLLVFENAPKRLSLLEDGLDVHFSGANSGRIFVLPLYGLTLQKPGITDDALAQAKKWNRILRLLPESVSRTARVDYGKDKLYFQDRYEWRGGKMPEGALLPLPPTLLLAQKGGMKIRVSRPAKDLELATMSGPFVAASGGNTVTWALDDVVHYVPEIRVVSGFADCPASRAAHERMISSADQVLKTISQHPWSIFQKKRGKGEIGGAEPHFSNLLIATQYLPQDLGRKIKEQVLRELPVSILNDDLEIEGRKPGTKGPINTKITSPSTGKTFSLLSRHCRDNGIDCPCWEALRLSMYERIGRFCNADEVLRKNWKQITMSYDPIVNSHDWANSISWDSFGGIRVGNGFQENTIFHSGLIAYARMAHRLGMPNLRDQAAYYALLQLVGTKSCASASTMEYLRRVRPMLAAGETYQLQERLEEARPNHHLEFNERTGFHHGIICPDFHYYSNGFIMTLLPEIIRPFREQWGDFSTEQMNFKLENGLTYSHYEYQPVDYFLYMTDNPPFSVEKLILRRLEPEVRQKLTPFEQLSDDRAAWESFGKISYRRLW